jgi:hypothetical protein
MRSFKFFSGRSTELNLDSPSWIYDTNVNLDGFDHLIVTEQYRGIHDFLSQFPNNFIAVVKSITCNGRTHTGTSIYPDGWGFDITSDLITIEHYRFTENDELYDDTNHS